MIAILTAFAVAASPPVDTKATDAVAAFSQLCVGIFTSGKSEIDPLRFSVTQLDAETVKQVKPDLAGQNLWDVSGKASDAHMLVHYEPAGMCVVEVAEANEQAIRAEYLNLVDQTAKELSAKAERQEDQIHDVQGKPATTSMWRLDSDQRNIMLAITTYPDPEFMIQHLMTVSYVR